MGSSNVWEHFEKRKDNIKAAICKLCKKCIKCDGGSTSGMISHLKLSHKILVKRAKTAADDDCAGTSASSSTFKKDKTLISSFLQRETLEEIVSRLIALDGFSYYGVTNSSFIRQSICKLGYKLPKNSTGTMELVKRYYDQIKIKVVEQLQSKISNGKRLSLSVDEWTSIKNRRYCNIILYDENENYNLGLARITGKCDAKKIQEIVKNQLNEFNIDFDHHILCSINDGAAVMQKYNRESPVEQVLCLNHALHLAVIKFFYQKHVADDEPDQTSIESEEDIIMDDEYDCDANTDDNNSIEPDDNIIIEDINTAIENDEHRHSIFYIQLQALRTVIKYFRVSSLKNDFLQDKIKNRLGKELELKIDVRTRWNSIDPMIERYLQVKKEVKEAMEYFNCVHLLAPIDEEYLLTIQKILEPVRIAAEALARNDATLITAESIIELLCSTLEKNNDSPISYNFLVCLKHEIDKRRNIKLLSLVQYMLNPKNLMKRNFHFNYCSKSSTVAFGKKLIERLFKPDEQSGSDSDENDEPAILNTDLKSQFQKAISTAIVSISSKPAGLSSSVQKDFIFFEMSGEKSHTLTLLFEALQTAKPTSTGNERTFSIASRVCTKIRTRLSDENLHIIVFLKYFFLKQNEIKKH